MSEYQCIKCSTVQLKSEMVRVFPAALPKASRKDSQIKGCHNCEGRIFVSFPIDSTKKQRDT